MNNFYLLVTYLAIGTLWSWFAIKLYYLRFNNSNLMVLTSIILNCLFFPLSMVFGRFCFITREKALLSDNVFVEERYVTMSIILEPIKQVVTEEKEKIE